MLIEGLITSRDSLPLVSNGLRSTTWCNLAMPSPQLLLRWAATLYFLTCSGPVGMHALDGNPPGPNGHFPGLVSFAGEATPGDRGRLAELPWPAARAV